MIRAWPLSRDNGGICFPGTRESGTQESWSVRGVPIPWILISHQNDQMRYWEMRNLWEAESKFCGTVPIWLSRRTVPSRHIPIPISCNIYLLLSQNYIEVQRNIPLKNSRENFLEISNRLRPRPKPSTVIIRTIV